MAAGSMIWIIFFLVTTVSCQYIHNKTLPNQGLCKSEGFSDIKLLYNYYKDCVVVIGNLKLGAMEKTLASNFTNVTLNNLIEVTGFVVVYRVKELTSLGLLLPNLARIRGEHLLNNIALVIHDVQNLTEIGLYNLLKIDRGGVVIWDVPHACFLDTVNWDAIGPTSRHDIKVTNRSSVCQCNCKKNSNEGNYCWNTEKCQVFIEEEQQCHEECLGCHKTDPKHCTLCRNYTYNGTCVSQCPPKTIVLPDSRYCISTEECANLEGWEWRGECIFLCPVGYVEENSTLGMSCRPCADCNTTCGDLVIKWISTIQAAERCVVVNGSIKIHMLPDTTIMKELRTYLGRIEEVTDFIFIKNSPSITSLDFLPSLRRIGGRKLNNNKYSLVINDMVNLRDLFTKNVTKNLKIDNGTIHMYNNPVLCMNHIEPIMSKLKIQPDTKDLPLGNGYSGSCDEISVGCQIRVLNETSALVMLSALYSPDAHYSVLFVRLPSQPNHQVIVPETCSDSEWQVVNVHTSLGHQTGIVELTSLRPASNYAVCVETYDPILRRLSRSNITNFSTPIGSLPPPFIKKLLAFRPAGTVQIEWVDHNDYSPYLTHYKLDIILIDIPERDIGIKDHCIHFELPKTDHSLHKVVMRPPSDYVPICSKECERKYLRKTKVKVEETMTEEFFDVCSVIDCQIEEDVIYNSTYKTYVKTLTLNLTSRKTTYKVTNLAPYRDYRFRLRSCSGSKCSRSARGVVRTLATNNADIPSIGEVKVYESGYITIKWNPPELSNGPILSYTIEVHPGENEESESGSQTSCVLANQTDAVIRSVQAAIYYIRVCTRSMAHDRVCSPWKPVKAPDLPNISWLWTSTLFGFLLCIGSIVTASVIKKCKRSEGNVPILDDAWTERNESEPPSIMFSDFTVLYSIPLRETRLE